MALGSGSVADRANSVSVGSEGNERQITNVAAGTEDTDAVNKAQLDEVGKTASNTDHFFKATDSEDSGAGAYVEGDNATAAGEATNAIGNGASAYGSGANAVADGATAVGYNSLAAGQNSAAFGQNAQATGPAAVAVGGNAVDENGDPLITNGGVPVDTGATSAGVGGTAVGASAQADGFAATAAGVGAFASGAQSSAFGAVANAIGDYSTAVGTQSCRRQRQHGSRWPWGRSRAAVVRRQATGERSTVFGAGATQRATTVRRLVALGEADGVDSTALGYFAYAPGDKPVRWTARSGHGDSSTAVGSSARRDADSVALGANATADATTASPWVRIR